MTDDTRYAIILGFILLLIGTCGGLEQNTLTYVKFTILTTVELAAIILLIPKKKK